MKNFIDVAALLRPLFDEYGQLMKPASERALGIFKSRAGEREVPPEVVEELTEFYSIIDGVPCLDSLEIHRCDDLVLFEWWEQRDLWLGQRDFFTLRWSGDKRRYCVGDASEVSFSPNDEFRTFGEAVNRLIYPSQ